MNFRDFFEAATGHTPYEYQCRLACGEKDDGQSEEDWLTHPDPKGYRSRLINVPTGLGKTAAVVLAWLWNRVAAQIENCKPEIENGSWPRRLVYCLPMRTLVEQTQREVRRWLLHLARRYTKPQDGSDLRWLALHSPIVLMGGEDLTQRRREWDLWPEKPAILVGTQDMLLSRALNRGYGMSRARWPMHFGLLNNDSLWVLDETQLMGVGVRTSSQLEGLRRKICTAGPVATWWASATLDTRLLDTPDHREEVGTNSLEANDRRNTDVAERIDAVKRLAWLPSELTFDSAKAVGAYIKKLAGAIVERHEPGTLTIVILNRVDRAKHLFVELQTIANKQRLPRLVLVHSRFRPMERENLSSKIKEPGEKIIVATQAIEAGVDISSRTLITELAPWSSLVQRFGRCNRKGEFNRSGGADIFWINLQAEDEKDSASLALPYTEEQLATARNLLAKAEGTGAAPSALRQIEKERTAEPIPEPHILRRKDLIELFDTTPDLAGVDIDVGRYIRDDDDRDVQAFWRKIPEGEQPDGIEPLRKELVRVSLSHFSKFLKGNKTRVWHWDVLRGEWRPPERPSPGQTYLVDYALGGYSEELGWTGEKAGAPFRILSREDQPKQASPRDGQARDDESLSQFQSLEEHTEHVVDACGRVIAALAASHPWSEPVLKAAEWHDVGKAHEYFQEFLAAKLQIPPRFEGHFLAKTPRSSPSRHDGERRPFFRHELASALAWLQEGGCKDPFTESLVAYLIAAHHGKVRLSIRSMPGERAPHEGEGKEVLFARGIWDGDELFAEKCGKTLTLCGRVFGPVKLDLSCMRMGHQDGHSSWSSRALSLRDSPQLGVFRLAWLETLLRAADGRASAMEAQSLELS